MNFSECPYQNLLSLDLKKFRERACTTSLGDMFQVFTTLFENAFARTFNLDRFSSALDPYYAFIFRRLYRRIYQLKFTRQ